MEREPEPQTAALFRDRDFLKLWVGQTVSKFGSGMAAARLI